MENAQEAIRHEEPQQDNPDVEVAQRREQRHTQGIAARMLARVCLQAVNEALKLLLGHRHRSSLSLFHALVVGKKLQSIPFY